MRRQFSAGLTLFAIAFAAPVAAHAQVTPDLFNVPAPTVGTGIDVDTAGSVWFSQGQGETGYLGRLDTAQAAPGTSNGMTKYPTPDGPSCCATAVRGITVDSARGRVWFVRNDGYIGYANPATVSPETTNGMQAVVVTGGVSLQSIAIAADGTGWFTEYGASNTAGFPGARVSSIDGNSLGITPGTNLAFQSGTLDSSRYDAKPWGITLDAAGVPWFTESSAGNPGYRIGRVNGGGYSEYVITPCAPVQPCSGTNTGTGPTGIAVAPDGAIWFTNQVNYTFSRFDPVLLTFTHYKVNDLPGLTGSVPRELRAAVDGTLWMTVATGSFGAPRNAIVRIVPGTGVSGASATVFPLGAGLVPFGVAPDTKGNVWFTAGDKIGRLTGVVTPPGGGGGGGVTPTPTVTPAPVPSSIPLTPSASGKATLGNPAVRGTTVTVNQICVGPPADRCSLVYLIDTREYVTGFPGSKGTSANAAAKPKTRKVTIGKLTVTLMGGQSKKVTIKLNAKGKKLLKSYKKLPSNLTVTQKLLNGKTKTIKRKKITFKR